MGFRAWAGGLERGTSLGVLLVLLTILPAACVLWFMNEAVTTQTAAARQSVLEAYRGQLRLVRSRVDEHWRAHAARLDGDDEPPQHFAQLIHDGLADGAVLLAPDGRVSYPDRADRPSRAAAAIDQALAEAESVRLKPDALVDRIATQLNDYSIPIAASERLAFIGRLRALSPNVRMPTEAALRLSMALAGAGRPAPPAGHLQPTAIRDVWAMSSSDGRVVALFWTGRLEAMMHDLLHQVTPAGIRFMAFPPDVEADAEAITAGVSMPGWQLSFFPLATTPLDDAGKRQAIVYVSVAMVGIALMAVLALAAGRSFRRHLRLARLKTDLVATVSHELRTPLASMRVLVDGLLADDELDPAKTREYLRLLATENARLSRLIENFLAFSRLERGRQQFVFTAAHPSSIVSAATQAIGDRLPAGANFRVEIEPALPPLVADADALTTALVNLLDNALKYTPPEKQIVLRASREKGDIVFTVGDNGIGIAAREQRRIFRRFYRVDDRLARETGGVGLGLSIVELIVRAHGGSVDVQSEAGAGSTFSLRLPCATGEIAA